MLSSSRRPLARPEFPQPWSGAPPPEQPDADGGGILETVREDVVTLEYLIGVRRRGRECSLVRYRPTEKHKQCAGVKLDPVLQINKFLSALRDESVPQETCLHTVLNPARKYLWIRVSLADHTELSLEPLWTIKGRVELYSKSLQLVITIEEPTLRLYALNPCSRLLVSQSRGCWTEDILAEAEDFLAEEGMRPTRRRERLGGVSDQERDCCESETEPSSDESAGERRGEERVAGRGEPGHCTVLENTQKCTWGSRARAGSEPRLRHSNLKRKTRKVTRSKLNGSLRTVRRSFRRRGTKTTRMSGGLNGVTPFGPELALENKRDDSPRSQSPVPRRGAYFPPQLPADASDDRLAPGQLRTGDMPTVFSHEPERVNDSDSAHEDPTRSNPSLLPDSPRREKRETEDTSVAELPADVDRTILRGCSLM